MFSPQIEHSGVMPSIGATYWSQGLLPISSTATMHGPHPEDQAPRLSYSYTCCCKVYQVFKAAPVCGAFNEMLSASNRLEWNLTFTCIVFNIVATCGRQHDIISKLIFANFRGYLHSMVLLLLT